MAAIATFNVGSGVFSRIPKLKIGGDAVRTLMKAQQQCRRYLDSTETENTRSPRRSNTQSLHHVAA